MVFDPWFDDRIGRCESRAVGGLTNECAESMARRLLNYFIGINKGYELRTETSSEGVIFSILRPGLLSRKKVMEVFQSPSGDGHSGYVTEFRIYPAALDDATGGAKREANRLIAEYSAAR